MKLTNWHWEQDENGRFARMSGPVLEMLGFRREEWTEGQGGDGGASTPVVPLRLNGDRA